MCTDEKIVDFVTHSVQAVWTAADPLHAEIYEDQVHCKYLHCQLQRQSCSVGAAPNSNLSGL